MSPEIKPLLILVEDDDDDALLVQEAIEELKLPIQLKRVKDATQLFDFLYQDPLKPSLVLLDLNLPQMNGKEILSHMKQHEASRSIPIVIYTTSQNPDDIRQCYQLGANAFIRKPIHFSEIKEIFSSLYDHWFRFCLLPSKTL